MIFGSIERDGLLLAALIALMSVMYWAGHHNGWAGCQEKADAAATALELERTQQYVDDQVRVHQADVDNAGITLHVELQLQMQQQQLPQILEESRNAIDNAPALRTCRLPDALLELRQRQAARSAQIAADTAGPGH